MCSGRRRAAFSTIAGRLQATGTAGDANETSESRGQALRRTVEQFDEKDKFEFMLLDAQGVILATSSGTMTRDLTDGNRLSVGADFRQRQRARHLHHAPGRTGDGCDRVGALRGQQCGGHAPCHQPDAGGPPVVEHVTAATGVGVLVLVFTIWSGLFLCAPSCGRWGN